MTDLRKALPAIVFALRYDDLGDEEWMSWERSNERWERSWKPALEQEHFGDCIKQPQACFRCQAEDCMRITGLIEEGLKFTVG